MAGHTHTPVTAINNEWMTVNGTPVIQPKLSNRLTRVHATEQRRWWWSTCKEDHLSDETWSRPILERLAIACSDLLRRPSKYLRSWLGDAVITAGNDDTQRNAKALDKLNVTTWRHLYIANAGDNTARSYKGAFTSHWLNSTKANRDRCSVHLVRCKRILN